MQISRHLTTTVQLQAGAVSIYDEFIVIGDSRRIRFPANVSAPESLSNPTMRTDHDTK